MRVEFTSENPAQVERAHCVRNLCYAFKLRQVNPVMAMIDPDLPHVSSVK